MSAEPSPSSEPDASTLVLIDRFPDDLLHELSFAALCSCQDFDDEVIERLRESLRDHPPAWGGRGRSGEAEGDVEGDAEAMSEAVRRRHADATRNGTPPEVLKVYTRAGRP